MKGAISRRKVFPQWASAALLALYDAVGLESVFVGVKVYENGLARLTAVQKWYNPANRPDVGDDSLGFNDHAVKTSDHAHRTEQIDIKHALYSSNVGVDRRHGVSYTTMSWRY